MPTTPQDFEDFLKRRQAASDAWTQGDPAPLRPMLAHDLPATFFGPLGGFTAGAAAVAALYDRDSAMFAAGSDFAFEPLLYAASDDIGCWVGFMRGTARMKGSTDAIPMALRVTEVFRREDGAWTLVHRHADSLASPADHDQP